MGLDERALGAGYVEQRSNGGCWTQGVYRGQSSNRGVRARSGGDFGGGVCARCLEGKRGCRRPKKKRKKKMLYLFPYVDECFIAT